MRTVVINPSDFPYLFDACSACYWRKCNGFQQVGKPGGNYAIGKAFDEAARALIKTGKCKELGIDYPIVGHVEKDWVCSEPIPYPDLGVQLVIRGKTDRRFLTSRDTIVLVDFKASAADPRKFFDQLMLYSLAMTKPDKGEGVTVEAIGIVQWDMAENRFDLKGDPLHGRLSGPITWTELEMDWIRIYELLDQAAKVAALPEPPMKGEFCEFCFAIERAMQFDKFAIAKAEAASA